jgi:hypothetical protein
MNGELRGSKYFVLRGKIDHTVMPFLSASSASRHSKAAPVPSGAGWIPEVLLVPLIESVRIVGLEENAAHSGGSRLHH